MRLYIAGGCGEHGRNCFLIEGETYSILVDCGIGRNVSFDYPLLSKEQIKKIQYCFLTHSHKDHTGALEWLTNQGFCGKIYMTEETKNHFSSKFVGDDFLYSLLEQHQLDSDLKVYWGRNGHCLGSVWYLIEFEKTRLFFSGDYSENSNIYACDFVRNIAADLAVIDCAYGDSIISAEEEREKLKNRIFTNIEMKKTTLLPVPAWGRGIELLSMVLEQERGIPVYYDDGIKKQLSYLQNTSKWILEKELIKRTISCHELKKWKEEPAILFLSDPQLEKKTSQFLAKSIITAGGEIILTGHIYHHTFAKKLIDQNQAEILLYPIHMNREQAEEFCKKNDFKKIVLNHCASAVSPFFNAINLNPGAYIGIKKRVKSLEHKLFTLLL